MIVNNIIYDKVLSWSASKDIWTLEDIPIRFIELFSILPQSSNTAGLQYTVPGTQL